MHKQHFLNFAVTSYLISDTVILSAVMCLVLLYIAAFLNIYFLHFAILTTAIIVISYYEAMYLFDDANNNPGIYIEAFLKCISIMYVPGKDGYRMAGFGRDYMGKCSMIQRAYWFDLLGSCVPGMLVYFIIVIYGAVPALFIYGYEHSFLYTVMSLLYLYYAYCMNNLGVYLWWKRIYAANYGTASDRVYNELKKEIDNEIEKMIKECTSTVITRHPVSGI